MYEATAAVTLTAATMIEAWIAPRIESIAIAIVSKNARAAPTVGWTPPQSASPETRTASMIATTAATAMIAAAARAIATTWTERTACAIGTAIATSIVIVTSIGTGTLIVTATSTVIDGQVVMT